MEQRTVVIDFVDINNNESVSSIVLIECFLFAFSKE